MSRAEFMRFARGFYGSRVRSHVVYVLGQRLCIARLEGHEIAKGEGWAGAYLSLRFRIEAEEQARKGDSFAQATA